MTLAWDTSKLKCATEHFAQTQRTSDAIDHERIQLLFAMFAHARQVGCCLCVAIKQIIQQGQGHLLWCAAVGMHMQQVTETILSKVYQLGENKSNMNKQ